MHMDPILPDLVLVACVVLAIGFLLRRIRQPHVVIYLITGCVVGPAGLGILTDVPTAARVGDIGVVLLLFFLGMEVSLPRLLASWRVAIIGTLLQVGITTGMVILLGSVLGWPLSRAVLMGFVISLSSTAVVISVLRDRQQLDTEVGYDAVGILLVQDLAIVPMLLVIGLMGDQKSSPLTIGIQVGAGIAIAGLFAFVIRRGALNLPLAARFRDDHELQVFAAFALCFGLATLTGLAQLSTALGAFVAGIVVASAKETEWVHRSLEPLRVLLVAFFFAAVGMQIDVAFVRENFLVLAALVGLVLFSNTVLNALILRVLGRRWRTGLYAGALLAQVGEFSFVLAAVGQQQGLTTDYGYKLAVGLIALSLLVSPFWVGVFGALTDDSAAGLLRGAGARIRAARTRT